MKKAAVTNTNLALVDIKLEGKMDGIEASGCIIANTDPAIVYLTAHTESDLFDRAKKTQPYGYITQAVTPQEQLRTVEMALYKHEMEKRLRESGLPHTHPEPGRLFGGQVTLRKKNPLRLVSNRSG